MAGVNISPAISSLPKGTQRNHGGSRWQRRYAGEQARQLASQAKNKDTLIAIRDLVAKSIRVAGPRSRTPLSELSAADTTLADGWPYG